MRQCSLKCLKVLIALKRTVLLLLPLLSLAIGLTFAIVFVLDSAHSSRGDLRLDADFPHQLIRGVHGFPWSTR